MILRCVGRQFVVFLASISISSTKVVSFSLFSVLGIARADGTCFFYYHFVSKIWSQFCLSFCTSFDTLISYQDCDIRRKLSFIPVGAEKPVGLV